MMRRRYYGGEVLEAFPLVAPVHEDGTYLTPDEIAAQLGSVNIVDKFNQNGIPNKKYAYTINNSLESFTTPNIAGDFWYHEKVNGIEQKTKYGQNVAVTPTSGSTDRYIIACGEMDEANCTSGGEYLFTGKCISVYGSSNSSLLYVFHNRIVIINSFQRSSIKGSVNLLNKSIISIKGSSFNNCNNIESVYIGNNIVNFEINAFSDSKNIKSVFIEEGISSLPNLSFYRCTSLVDVNIPLSIEDIGDSCFRECITLPKITLTSNVKRIGNYAFISDNKLIDVDFLGSISDWMSIDFANIYSNPTYYSKGLSLNGIEINDIDIPSNIDTIKKYSFVNCTNINSVTCSDAIISIQDSAFFGCTSLTDFHFSNNIQRIENKAFYNTPINRVFLPSSLTYIALNAFESCNYIATVDIYSKEYYNWSVFRSIKNVSIGSFASDVYYKTYFSGEEISDAGGILYYKNQDIFECMWCSSDNSSSNIIIDKGCKKINNSAFKNCRNITGYLRFPSSLTEVDANAFYYCQNLNSAYDIFNNLVSVGDNAFYRCEKLQGELVMPSTLVRLGNIVFQSNFNLTSVILGESINEIPIALFQGCIGLNSIIIPSNINKINSYSFDECRTLSNINIPSSITSIDIGVFRNAGIEDLYLNWDSDNILNYNTSWNLNAKNVTLHIPQGTTELYSAKGYTTDVFGTIIDDIIIE